MPRSRSRVAILFAALLSAASADGSRTAGAAPTIIIYTPKPTGVMTDLQRTLMDTVPDSPTCRVVVNASAAVRKDGSIDPKAVAWDDLEFALRKLTSIRVEGQKFRVSISMRYHPGKPSHAATTLLGRAAQGTAAACGFDEIRVSSVVRTDDRAWDRELLLMRVYDTVKKGQPAEPAARRGAVTTYAVRAEYSGQLLNADCVVELARPFKKGDDGSLTKEEEANVVAAVGARGVKGGKSILFRANYTAGGSSAISAFADGAAAALARRLKFDGHSTQQSYAP